MHYRRLPRLVLLLALVCLTLAGCDDGDADPQDTAAADTSTMDTSESGDATEADSAEADTGEADTAPDATDAEADTGGVWTDPARFALIFLDPGVGLEVVYMVGATSIVIPEVELEAESLALRPIEGQRIAIDDERNSITPTESITDAEGRTAPLILTLADDMSGPSATHTFVPYIVGNVPDPVRTIAVIANGLEVDAMRPDDGTGTEVAPIADDGASTWTLTVDLARPDANAAPIPEGLELELEFITNVGDPPLEFVETTERALRWAVDPAAPTRTVDFRSVGTEPGDARIFVRLYQADGLRGQRIETIAVEAAP